MRPGRRSRLRRQDRSGQTGLRARFEVRRFALRSPEPATFKRRLMLPPLYHSTPPFGVKAVIELADLGEDEVGCLLSLGASGLLDLLEPHRIAVLDGYRR